MTNTPLSDLLKDFVCFSKIHEKLRQAINEFNEEQVVSLELEGRTLLGNVMPRLSTLQFQNIEKDSDDSVSIEKIQSLIKVIEKSQSQLSLNTKSIENWKKDLGGQLQTASEFLKQHQEPSTSYVETKNNLKISQGLSQQKNQEEMQGRKPSWGSPSEQVTIGQQFDRRT